MRREIKVPGPEHAITIERAATPVEVTAGGVRIARSDRALVLHENGHRPVYYIPVADIEADRLEPTDTTSYCPYKGDCSYFAVVTPAGFVPDAGWTYERPYPAVREIAGHIAFYRHRVEIAP